jgi:hypothetical protein
MVEYPKIVIADKRKRDEIGSSIEHDAKELLHETSHTWPSLFGISCCVMYLLDSHQEDLARSTAVREGALPKELAYNADSDSKDSDDTFEGYRFAILTATQILENNLSNIDRYGIDEGDKLTIKQLANDVLANLRVFRKNLIATREHDQMWRLMESYGQRVQISVETLCVKLLVNEQRGEVERVLTYGI